jgi:diguanylate cyclase (GGDEF)-like protein
MRPSRRVILLTLVAVGCGALIVSVALVGMQQPRSDVQELNRRIYPASLALERATAQQRTAQQLFLATLSIIPASRSATIAQSQAAGNRADAAWKAYRKRAFGSAREVRLQRRYDQLTKDGTVSGAAVFGLLDSPDRDAYAAGLTHEQEISTQTIAILERIDRDFYETRRGLSLQHAEDSLESLTPTILIVFGIVLVLGLINALVHLRGAFREERRSDGREDERRDEQRRADLENQLQRGLEMEPNEDATFSVVGEALRLVRPDEPVEVLVADSSRAHFHQVLSTDPEGLPGCGVTSPGDCPAASSGQTRYFVSSTRLDACPYLRSREGPPRSAACIPISIAGTNTGVVHTTGPDQETPDQRAMSDLELVARKAGERVGYLRVLARTETQARIDALTGLFNRRNLEHHASEILTRGDEFVVAFADLDHFKDLNDKHGHEIGDRALRLFGRVLRDSVRPADVPARYGGEEFVVLLPDCTIVDARSVADRLRERLASALAGATIPKFTVSVGLAAWEAPESFDDTVARADAALLRAKRSGRDRVLAANELSDLDESELDDPGTKAPGTNGPGTNGPGRPLVGGAPPAPS